MTQSALFQTAVQKAKAGERSQARNLLLELVDTNPEHELAWLWLSQLVEEPEDKIIALENALTLNPQRPQTQKRLNELRQKYNNASQPAELNFSANGSAQLFTTEEARFEQINQLFAAGNITTGRQRLAAFLRRYADHEAGWWLMVQNADSQSNLLKGLEHLLRLNSGHPEVPSILASIKPTNEELLQMGRLYERLEQWDTAVRYYKRALRSPNNADRLLAKKRLPHVEEQVRLANIKVTGSTATVMRLAIGPTLLYAMLTLVQAGLNPLQVSPLLCTGNMLFLVGLLLMGGLTYEPDHPWLRRLRETAVFQNNLLLRITGIFCVLLPILLLLLLTITRLLNFEFDPNSL